MLTKLIGKKIIAVTKDPQLGTVTLFAEGLEFAFCIQEDEVTPLANPKDAAKEEVERISSDVSSYTALKGALNEPGTEAKPAGGDTQTPSGGGENPAR